MKILPKGANAPLTNAGAVRVELRWPAGRGVLDAVCLAVTGDGRVPDDAWFLFYNQPQAPDGVIQLSAFAVGQTDCLLHLDRLPASIEKCVFAATLESGSFRELIGATLTATPQTGEAVGFTLTEAADEQALIFAEIYRHATGWKFRAIGQGFRGGLQPLAEHFGVEVSHEAPDASPTPPESRPPPAIPAPTPEPAPERGSVEPASPSPAPPADSSRARRSRGFPFKTLAALVILLGGGAGALWVFYPELLDDPGQLFKDSRDFVARLPAVYQPVTCAWTDAEVFERYHALGESYVKILQRVDRGNQRLASLRLALGKADAQCPASFLDDSRQEIDQLEKLPVSQWIGEATQLNSCAGLMIKKIESALNEETRPIVIQRLVHEADRARNLESDLTNISRDLAYLSNKTGRLIDGFKENLDACP
ncbi:stress protein [Thiocystis minor]|uniref:TerD family protein n=1 Tax=Thiocystis minor TaxID=61597 RepID=UPI0019145D3F|nr:TerD family protein [Thiocystis minor]MBK5965182.1 stress protein [Thiocystis minor]